MRLRLGLSAILVVFFWMGSCSCWWDLQQHEYSIETSQIIKDAIKEEILNNIDRIANTTAAEQLRKDLETGSTNMMTIDVITANQIFSLLQIKDPGCDKNQDKVLSHSELKCLNKIWKYYLPK